MIVAPLIRARSVLSLFFVLGSLTACGATPRGSSTAAQASSPALPSRQDRVAVFEDVWKTIDEQYYDSTFHGVDWQDVRTRYRPRFEAAASPQEFYGLFETMLAELRDAHTVLERPGHSQPDAKVQPPGDVGITLAEAEGKIVVAKVDPASDAARAGVAPGMILRTVNGRTVEELFAEIRRHFAGSSSERSMKGMMMSALLHAGFLGPSRSFGIDDFDGRRRVVRVTHFGPSGPRTPELTARRLTSNVGYIAFDRWDLPAAREFEETLAKLMDTRGLIIDLRGNGGGASEPLLRIGSMFFRKETSFGSFTQRGGAIEEIHTLLPSRVYEGRVVLLVDEASGSSSEVFAVSMQEHARAKVMGRQTCGCVLNSWTKKLRGEGTLRWSARLYRSPKGRVLERVGVLPDETIALRIADLRQGRDMALAVAERALGTRSPIPEARLQGASTSSIRWRR